MAKTLAIVFGIVFVLVGLLGFFENPLVGMAALFETDMTHDLVHLIIGIILLVVAFVAAGQSALWLKIIGAVYLIVGILGLFTASSGSLLGIIAINDADNWLHLILGVILLAAGYFIKGETGSLAPTSSTPPSAPSRV